MEKNQQVYFEIEILIKAIVVKLPKEVEDKKKWNKPNKRCVPPYVQPLVVFAMKENQMEARCSSTKSIHRVITRFNLSIFKIRIFNINVTISLIIFRQNQ